EGHLPAMQWYSGSHSNSLVPIFARGAGWEYLEKAADENDFRYGRYLDNTELGEMVKKLLQ
ncbi:MAG: alkaline phosphatase, partial [bacterium]